MRFKIKKRKFGKKKSIEKFLRKILKIRDNILKYFQKNL